jgi:hypothetical protein
MAYRYVSILVIVLVLSGGIPIMSGSSMNSVSAKYSTNTQTQANSNECDTGTNCAITSPQSQGDGTVNSPVNTQTSNFNEEQPEAPTIPMPFGTASLRFLVKVECPTGVVCPSEQTFKYLTIGAPFDPRIQVAPNPLTFSGSHVIVYTFYADVLTTNVAVFFHVYQTNPPTPPGLTLSTRAFGTEPSVCEFVPRDNPLPGEEAGFANGLMGPGDNIECTVVNTYTRS